MNAIVGFSDMLVSGISGALSDKQREYVGDISQSSLHLLKVINEILDLAKIEADAAEILEAPVDLGGVVGDAMRLVSERAQLAGVALISEIPQGRALINADERMVKQIVINLLSNAVKFTENCGRVSVSAHLTCDRGINVLVTDNGIGMRKEDIPVALSKFGKLDTGLNRTNTGTGLGLPLVVEHMRLHGGTVSIASQPADGTTVTLQFPAQRTISCGAATAP